MGDQNLHCVLSSSRKYLAIWVLSSFIFYTVSVEHMWYLNWGEEIYEHNISNICMRHVSLSTIVAVHVIIFISPKFFFRIFDLLVYVDGEIVVPSR